MEVPEELLQNFQGIFPDADAETAKYFLRKQGLVRSARIPPVYFCNNLSDTGPCYRCVPAGW